MSKRRPPRVRAEWGWIAAVALIFTLSVWWFPARGGGPADTFTAGAGGKKAFFALVSELEPDVERHLEGPFPLQSAATLCIIGPARPPDPREWELLYEWVREGHTLIFAARYGDPAVDLSPFEARVEPSLALARKASGGREEDRDGDKDKHDEWASDAGWTVGDGGLETELLEGELEWQSQGYLVDESEDAQVLVSVSGQPQVFRQEVGRGVLVLCCSDYIFSNASLVAGDNALLAYRILESGNMEGPVYFDESLNASGTPKVVGLLVEPKFRAITLQLLLVVLAFGWWGSRRFGPPLPPDESPRRSIVEHAEALGNLYFKSGSGDRAVASYLEYFRRELRGQYAAARGRDLAALLSRRTGVKEKKLRRLLEEAKRVAGGGHVSVARAANIVRAFSRLKTKLEGAGHGV